MRNARKRKPAIKCGRARGQSLAHLTSQRFETCRIDRDSPARVRLFYPSGQRPGLGGRIANVQHATCGVHGSEHTIAVRQNEHSAKTFARGRRVLAEQRRESRIGDSIPTLKTYTGCKHLAIMTGSAAEGQLARRRSRLVGDDAVAPVQTHRQGSTVTCVIWSPNSKLSAMSKPVSTSATTVYASS